MSSQKRRASEVHTLGGDPNDQGVQRIVLATLGAETVAEPEELLLVDAVQHGHDRFLDDLVLQRRHRQWALFSIRLRYVRPARWQSPVRPAMNPCMQISEVSVKVCCVGLPCQTVYPGSGFALEREERLPEKIGADVVQERRKLLLPLPCGPPYALQRL
jgi:hypothetical protein